MKHCNNCNQDYDYGNYCPKCGGVLNEIIEYDIFGEPLNENKKVLSKKNASIGGASFIQIDYKEMLSFVSVGTAFVPIIGISFCILAFVFNLITFFKTKKITFQLILTLITLCFSIFWSILMVINQIGI